ncbi:MAG: amidohydrolase family protein [Kiritimatiellia bacterium]|nr:amidohydrolase family protein [Kiritimatiellia bacterium]
MTITIKSIIDSAVCLPVVKGKLCLEPWRQEVRQWKIAHTIAAPSAEFVAVYNTEANDQMAKLMKSRHSEISGLAVANPWYGKRAVQMLRKAFEEGLVGLYLHPARQGFKLGESIINPLIEVCCEYNRPVYSHTGTPVCAMPFQLAELARRFPAVTFVMGHAGYSDFSGYDLIPAAKQAPNIMIETSCTGCGVVKSAIDELGADRVLFGTGYPRSLPGYEFENFKVLNLECAAYNKIMHDNAIRLWKLRP